MSCPYSDEELDYWDSCTNPMGNACYECDDFDCEHNANYDENPQYWEPESDEIEPIDWCDILSDDDEPDKEEK